MDDMQEHMQIERGFVGAARGEEVDIRDSAVGAAAASRDLFLTNGGAQTILAAGGATLGEGSFVAFVLSPKVTVEPGARVLCSTPQALAFGAVVSAAILAVTRMVRRGRE